MKRSEWVVAAAAAVVAGGLAVLVSDQSRDATVLAAIAVAVAGGSLVGAFVAGAELAYRRGASAQIAVVPLREWFRSGALGREEIVRLLDRIDRMGAHPALPVRTIPEMDRLRRLPSGEFLDLVARRLDEIEGPQ